MPLTTNRLIDEKSPYLLQHAHNPVDWYPWGEDAFTRARRENKPVFLSVGYSTCHWCHVMAHESFENPEIAGVLNQHFISIKVDREERPDIDRVYMSYVQQATGSGGWPMSVWLTPERKPFMGGTYFPPEDRWGRMGFKSVLHRIAEAWDKQGDQIAAQAEVILQQWQCADSGAGATAASPPGSATLDRGYRAIGENFDAVHGGFGGAPKFPHPPTLAFLLRYYARTGAQSALDMVLVTLHNMARGGVCDHIGGGFHRYSVDEAWHVPHFEKMLYDQAQLATVYAEAFQISGDAFYEETARATLDAVLHDMTEASGGFASAIDADSPLPDNPAEHGEGAFYVWTASEIAAALDVETAPLVAFHYGIEPNGNVMPARDPHKAFQGKNILYKAHCLEDTAQQFGLAPQAARAMLAAARERLRAVRAQRPPPHKDDKILTAWNGLAISAFARAARIFNEPRYRQAAQQAASFIKSTLYDPSRGRLLRRYRDGNAAIDGFPDDYAFLIQGLLDLYDCDFDSAWLDWALTLQATMEARFADAHAGGYYGASAEATDILVRDKEWRDGAEPSPNAAAADNLLRLARLTGTVAFTERAEQLFRAFGAQLHTAPHAMPLMLAALGLHVEPPRHIVVIGEPGATDTLTLLRAAQTGFAPNRTVIFLPAEDKTGVSDRYASWVRDGTMLKGLATAYVCENFACRLPITDPKQLAG